MTGELEPALPRHHDVEHEKVEGEALQTPPRLLCIGRGGDAVAVFGEKAAEQVADSAVVVDDEKVWCVVFGMHLGC